MSEFCGTEKTLLSRFLNNMKVSDINMMGHTHLAVGVGTGLAIIRPKTWPELLVGIGAGALGGLICDIDVGTSKSHKQADMITILSAVIVAAVILVDWLFHIGIQERLMQNETFAQVFTPMIIFIGICAYGKGTSHRTFMHSLLAMTLLTACVGVMLPIAAPYFGLGFLSHIILDIFNKKRVRVFWPSQKGICIKACSSHGKVNNILFYTGTLISLVCILISVYGMYDWIRFMQIMHIIR